ncbi:ciliary microtubule-associated protein 2-like [Rhopilema esculentum]|uniref:ciliary microtubule-associated protein 2-like n=1 Tax=Rhopilema esculentum TaxID=499914 RepID=UPI0031E09FF5
MSDKKFKGAPFGTQKSRFDVAGIHPKSKTPGTITQVFYDKKSMGNLSTKLGPGTYNIETTGSFCSSAVANRASGPGWKKAYETSQRAKIPHLLYREEWEKKQEQKRLLGPGSYNIPDSMQWVEKKPGSTHGICSTRATRFKSEHSKTPGPGTYGKGGIPHSAIEEKQRKSASTVGMLDAGSSGKRQLPEVGSALCPGQYNHRSFTDELSERVISKRGPYDLFTGDRNRPITVGYFAAPSKVNLGPGEYHIKSFLQEWDDNHKQRHGKFGKVDRAPAMPSERLYCCTLSQWPRKSEEPGPGNYDVKNTTKPEAKQRPAFGNSADRMDRHARKFFLGNVNAVGAGRYNITHWKESQKVNGYKSAFSSNTKRWDSGRDKYLMERIRAKDVPVKDRVFLVPCDS